jgi:hypothetical protein
MAQLALDPRYPNDRYFHDLKEKSAEALPSATTRVPSATQLRVPSKTAGHISRKLTKVITKKQVREIHNGAGKKN